MLEALLEQFHANHIVAADVDAAQEGNICSEQRPYLSSHISNIEPGDRKKKTHGRTLFVLHRVLNNSCPEPHLCCVAGRIKFEQLLVCALQVAVRDSGIDVVQRVVSIIRSVRVSCGAVSGRGLAMLIMAPHLFSAVGQPSRRIVAPHGGSNSLRASFQVLDTAVSRLLPPISFEAITVICKQLKLELYYAIGAGHRR